MQTSCAWCFGINYSEEGDHVAARRVRQSLVGVSGQRALLKQQHGQLGQVDLAVPVQVPFVHDRVLHESDVVIVVILSDRSSPAGYILRQYFLLHNGSISI